MKERKGISLIVLIVTIIVMIIIAGAIIISLSEANIIDQAENAVRVSEGKNIRDAVLTSMILTNEGDVDVSGTYSAAKSVLEDQVKSIGALQEDGTFTVEGKYDTYILKIQGIGVEIISGSGNEEGTPGDEEPDEQLDGWQGTYKAVHTIDTNDILEGIIDGKGTWTQVVQNADTPYQQMSYPYTYDDTTKILTMDISSIGGTTMELKLYNLEEVNNKVGEVLYQDGGINVVFTTNGLAGLKVDDLTGKTFSYLDSSNGKKEFVFTTDHNVVCTIYNSTGRVESTNTVIYFKLPSYIENNEDKMILIIGEYHEISIERDSEGNIIKMTDLINNETYELETETNTES